MKSAKRRNETFTSIKEGGSQIEFIDEDPAIHRGFEAALAGAGAQCGMGAYHPFCSLRKAAE
jgi:hypothetical protein